VALKELSDGLKSPLELLRRISAKDLPPYITTISTIHAPAPKNKE
jgi:hypothetical protein